MALVDNNETLSIDDFEYPYSKMPNFETIKSSFNPNEHEIYLFKNKYGFYDSYIFQLGKEITQNSFGWLFPISVFRDTTSFLEYLEVSSIEDMTNSSDPNAKFFVKTFLYSAFCHLILNQNELATKNPNASDFITDFYDKETFILIVHKEQFQVLKLDIEFIIPGLYQFGFSYIAKNEDFNTIEIFTNTLKIILQNPFSKLAIKPISENLQTETYIIELFKNLLKVELHPVMRFYLLYQIIELLINKVGLNKFSQRKAELFNYLTNANPSIFYQVQDLLKSFPDRDWTKEEKRINNLFDENTGLKISEYVLLVASSLFSPQYANLSELVYEHRNKLIHGYYKLQIDMPDIEEKLKGFNIEFEKLMIDVVTHYKDV